MTLFGKVRREKIIDRGEFNCPHCGVSRPYVRKERANVQVVFGIATKRLGKEPDLIECGVCGQGYNVDVLVFKPSSLHPGAARLISGVRAKLQKGFLPEYVLQDLIDQGTAPDVARSAVEIAQKELKSDDL